MNEKLLKKEYIIIALAAAVVAVLAAFSFFVVRPALKSSAALTKEINEKSREIENAQKTLKQEGDIKEAIKRVEDRLAYYKRQLPEERETHWLLEELNRIANKTGIKFVSVTPLPPEKNDIVGGGSYFEIPMRIALGCGYHHLGRFINEIENSSRFMKVKDVRIALSKKDILRHDVTLVMSSFVFEFKNSRESQ